MNLKEIRNLRGKSKQNLIRRLQYLGRIKTYYSENDYVAYDEEEYNNYRKNVKLGRPHKKEV